ncbi:3-hydroxyisobutyrate dehydrogenase, mitochondrial [Magallana gigas]|uniref:3-hydroxyisobutyrate dehydrogenase n=1 Tax=Magallana gigas TaxID=29159 RepID=A0A8W8NEE1_MAGGI|nr:3-hydroxyisobutyrate dehydrogenase, mitochondrial [Crassostrea gigas]
MAGVSRTVLTTTQMFSRFVTNTSKNISCKRCFSVTRPVQGEKPLIGFIGLGNMGNHMARNLVSKGYPVLVYDVNTAAVDGLKQAGAKTASNPAEIAANTDRIVTMLPASKHVQEVYTGNNGIFSKVVKGTIMLDSSTIDPAVSQDMAKVAEGKGAFYLDAPVSGGVNAAKQALLTFMVGGPDSKFPEAQEILQNMGKNVVHCGAVGTGQAAKICNNMLLGISMIGTSETMNLGIKLGLDPKMLAKILNMSSGRCWSSDTYNPCPGVFENVPSSNNYDGGFGTALMTKDLGLANNAAKDTNSAVSLGQRAFEIYTKMTEKGYGGKDFSVIFKILEEMSGPEVEKKKKEFFDQ